MKISGFTFIKNAEKLYIPAKESILSILPICDEFIIAIGDNDIGDNTLKIIQSIQSEKIKIIQDKFVNFERGFIHKDDDYIQQLTVIWGAKESLYKIYPFGGLTFKNDIDINSFQIADKKTTGYIKVDGWDKNYDIHFEQLNGFTLVYALDTSKND